MSPTEAEALTAQIAEDFASAEYSNNAMVIAQQEFMLAARFGRWSAAQEARDKFMSLAEAMMDAFTKACRETEALKNG